MLDKGALLNLFAQARKRAEVGDADISIQQAIIATLEQKGLSSEKSRAILQRLITAQDIDLTEMERLLDELDKW